MRDYRLLTMPPKALVGACSDDNYPFVDFLETEYCLHEGYYFPLRIPGGLAPLAYPNALPVHFEAVHDYMQIAMGRQSIDQLIVITHELCGFYKMFLPDFIGNERDDAPRIIGMAKQLFPGRFTRVNICHTTHIGNNNLHFERITEHSLQTVS